MKYALVECFGGGNLSLIEIEADSKESAIQDFQKIFPLNDEGFYKPDEDTSFIVCEIS